MHSFKRFSIIQLTVFSASLLVVIVIGLVIRDLVVTYKQFANASLDAELVELLDALEKVAHNHAVERGLTAGYLGAPSPQAKSKVDAQRDKADQSVNAVNALLNNDWPAVLQINAKTSQLREHLQGKSSLRSQVDRQQGQAAFLYYSTLNKLAIEAAQSIALSISNNDVANPLNSALILAQVKERLGQVRGKVNGALARRQAGALFSNEVGGYVRDRDIQLSYLSSSLGPTQGSALEASLSSSTAQSIQAILDSVLAENVDFERLPGPGEWFPMATQQIGDVKKLLDQQWLDVKEVAEEQRGRALVSLVLTLVLTLAGLGLAALLNLLLIRSLKSQLASLENKLNRIADNGDLTINVAMNDKNELGAISRAINKTILALKDLIVGLDRSISAGSQLSQNLDSVTSEMVVDSKRTQDMSISIAAAVEEMSQTSGQIAEATVKTLEASKTLDTQIEGSQSLNQNMKDSVLELDKNMQDMQHRASTMEQKVSEISSILETINTLTEQTNLLALNAAIEAARAGEHGRGFAVVADEVRNLAQGSRDSSDKISMLLQELQAVSDDVIAEIATNATSVQEVVTNTNEIESNAEQLRSLAQLVEEMATSVSASAEQQSITFDQVSKDVSDVQDAATREYESAEKLRKVYDEAQLNNQTLQRTMQNFKIEPS